MAISVKGRLTWKADDVLDFALARAQTGMNRAVKFCEADAKRRARGKRLRDAIKGRVKVDGRTVEGAIYTTWYVGRFHELGTRKMRARPYLRPAVFENGAEITRLIGKG